MLDKNIIFVIKDSIKISAVDILKTKMLSLSSNTHKHTYSERVIIVVVSMQTEAYIAMMRAIDVI